MRIPQLIATALAMLAVPAAASTIASQADTSSAKVCIATASDPADVASHRAAAQLVLASYSQAAAQTQVMRAAPTGAAEVARVRGEARKLTMSSTARAHDEAMRAVAAVANYRGNDPAAMNRLLARVDQAADRLHSSLARGGGSSAVQTGAFKCNADRLECKEACQEAKGKACCCGCGVSYVACLVLG